MSKPRKSSPPTLAESLPAAFAKLHEAQRRLPHQRIWNFSSGQQIVRGLRRELARLLKLPDRSEMDRLKLGLLQSQIDDIARHVKRSKPFDTGRGRSVRLRVPRRLDSARAATRADRDPRSTRAPKEPPMTLRIISGGGLVPVESPIDGPAVDLSQDPDLVTNGFGVRIRRPDEPVQSRSEWLAMERGANEYYDRLAALDMKPIEREDQMRALGRSDFEQGLPERSAEELLARLPIPGLSEIARKMAMRELHDRYSFHYRLTERYRDLLVGAVLRLRQAASLPKNTSQFEQFMWPASAEYDLMPRSELAVWRSAPTYCRDAQALHDAAMFLAGYDVAARDRWVHDCVEWAVLPHLRKKPLPPNR